MRQQLDINVKERIEEVITAYPTCEVYYPLHP